MTTWRITRSRSTEPTSPSVVSAPPEERPGKTDSSRSVKARLGDVRFGQFRSDHFATN